MDFRDELHLGPHIYSIAAKSVPSEDGQPSSVALEFTGADHDGRIIAEGNVLVALEEIASAGGFLARALDGLATLHGSRVPNNQARAPRPPQAGKPWTDQLSDQLRERWLTDVNPRGASERIAEIADEFGRTRSSIRAQLARIGCDPDVPGRCWGTERPVGAESAAVLDPP